MQTFPTTESRILHRLCEEIAGELGITMTSLSQGWIIRLERGGLRRHIYAHNFELNSAAARNIASDKAATAAVLEADDIPCVEHRLFRHPEITTYVDPAGNWEAIRAFAEANDFNIVCKANESSGGHRVLLVTDPRALEAAVQDLFSTERTIVLSPFHEARREYRVVVLDGVVELMYAKTPPAVRGDGASTVLQLAQDFLRSHNDAGAITALLGEMDDDERSVLLDIPGAGEIVHLGWKHNLRLAGTVELSSDAKAAELALRATDAINLRFGAVDVLQCADGLRVLEVNSGFMVTHFVRVVADGDAIARRIYRRAIECMFRT